MKLLLVAAAVTIASLAIAAPAQANYVFSGSGLSGNFTGQAGEPFVVNADGGAAATQYLDNWGSPGVGRSVTPYLETDTAYGLEVTFAGGGPIDGGSIVIGNTAGCVGSTGGGTTFCTYPSLDIWQVFQTGPDTIWFLAQDPSFTLATGDDYFVNVFFDAHCSQLVACTGGAPTSFSGEWLTAFTPSPLPEPLTISLFGAGLAGAAALRRRRKAA